MMMMRGKGESNEIEINQLIIDVQKQFKELREDGDKNTGFDRIEEDLRVKGETLKNGKNFQNATISTNAVQGIGMLPAFRSSAKVKTMDNMIKNRPLSPASKLKPLHANNKKNASEKSKQPEPKVETLGETIEKIRSYDERVGSQSVHHTLIRNGVVVRDTPEFQAFKKSNRNIWYRIEFVLREVCNTLIEYDVPIAYLNGQKVVDLAMDELEIVVTREMFMNMLDNQDHVLSIMSLPGRRYIKNKNAAIVAIQSRYRCYRQHNRYVVASRRFNAATSISNWFRCLFYRKCYVKIIDAHRKKLKDQWRELQENFFGMEHMSTVIHIPSLGYCEQRRMRSDPLDLHEGLQLCRLLDSINRRVIYVSPYHLDEEVLEYYYKLLDMRGIPRTNLTIIVPENRNRFPSHFSLSKLLLYSPKALNRIKNRIEDGDAYIVPGTISKEDRLVAVALHAPVLGTDPDIASYIGTRGGSKEVFQEAQVGVPHGVHGMHDFESVQGSLGRLIAADMDIPIWNIISECGVMSFQYMAHENPTVQRLLKQRDHHGREAWASPLIQVDAAREISQSVEMPTEVLAHFVKHGAIIEAVPGDILSRWGASVLIHPDGRQEILNTFDVYGPAKLYPQQFIAPSEVEGICIHVAKTLFEKEVIGHVLMEFIAFREPKRRHARVWGVSILPGFSNSMSNYYMYQHLRGTKHSVAITVESLYNTNIGNFKTYGAFFKACRIYGLSFSMKTQRGVVLSLTGKISQGILGFVIIDSSVENAKAKLAQVLHFYRKIIGLDGNEKFGFTKPAEVEKILDSIKIR